MKTQKQFLVELKAIVRKNPETGFYDALHQLMTGVVSEKRLYEIIKDFEEKKQKALEESVRQTGKSAQFTLAKKDVSEIIKLCIQESANEAQTQQFQKADNKQQRPQTEQERVLESTYQQKFNHLLVNEPDKTFIDALIEVFEERISEEEIVGTLAKYEEAKWRESLEKSKLDGQQPAALSLTQQNVGEILKLCEETSQSKGGPKKETEEDEMSNTPEFAKSADHSQKQLASVAEQTETNEQHSVQGPNDKGVQMEAEIPQTPPKVADDIDSPQILNNSAISFSANYKEKAEEELQVQLRELNLQIQTYLEAAHYHYIVRAYKEFKNQQLDLQENLIFLMDERSFLTYCQDFELEKRLSKGKMVEEFKRMDEKSIGIDCRKFISLNEVIIDAPSQEENLKVGVKVHNRKEFLEHFTDEKVYEKLKIASTEQQKQQQKKLLKQKLVKQPFNFKEKRSSKIDLAPPPVLQSEPKQGQKKTPKKESKSKKLEDTSKKQSQEGSIKKPKRPVMKEGLNQIKSQQKLRYKDSQAADDSSKKPASSSKIKLNPLKNPGKEDQHSQRIKQLHAGSEKKLSILKDLIEAEKITELEKKVEKELEEVDQRLSEQLMRKHKSVIIKGERSQGGDLIDSHSLSKSKVVKSTLKLSENSKQFPNLLSQRSESVASLPRLDIGIQKPKQKQAPKKASSVEKLPPISQSGPSKPSANLAKDLKRQVDRSQSSKSSPLKKQKKANPSSRQPIQNLVHKKLGFG